MPQITVTLDNETYMDISENLPKGMKSAFVNRACRKAINLCGSIGLIMHIYAKKGEAAAWQALEDHIQDKLAKMDEDSHASE
tara:strand:+ start:277 stop:522 length:246 start_codon:yes stop_codon:yes gene_type:complete